jgi:putative hydrolase of the HAD superfamily
MSTPVLHPLVQPRGFSHVESWIFDLDNTLYPHEARIWPQVDARMTLYMSDMLGLDGLSARALQKYLYHRHGTTLKGLMIDYGVDPQAFMAFAHDIDHSLLRADAALSAALAALKGRKFIFTNGSIRHAENVAHKLGILQHFDGIFDLKAGAYVPKPERAAYQAFLQHFNIDPAKAAMFEDLAINLAVPHQLGMTTVLVTPQTPDPFRETFEQAALTRPFIDHITSKLTIFLNLI